MHSLPWDKMKRKEARAKRAQISWVFSSLQAGFPASSRIKAVTCFPIRADSPANHSDKDEEEEESENSKQH